VHVRVVAYDAEWPQRFAAERERLVPVFGPNLVALHHIGSTSVPGLRAKPIIDMLPVVRAIEAVDGLTAALAALGYEGLGEFGLAGRRYFRKGGDDRTHQLHVYGVGSTAALERHLAVPAYLRAHPAERERYGELKAALAARHPEDIFAYMDGKDVFMKGLEAKAVAFWRARPRRGPDDGP
jgi:GrpB-like predicted nucleotidyltransferase (UPF0157 family)